MKNVEKKITDLQIKLDPIKVTQQAVNFNNEIKKKLKRSINTKKEMKKVPQGYGRF